MGVRGAGLNPCAAPHPPSTPRVGALVRAPPAPCPDVWGKGAPGAPAMGRPGVREPGSAVSSMPGHNVDFGSGVRTAVF